VATLPRSAHGAGSRRLHDREIARLAIPALGALLAEPLYRLTDTAIVGHLGTPQLGGLAVATGIVLTLYALFIFLAYGTTAAVSRLLGAGDERRAAHLAVQSLWLALSIGVVVAAVGWVASDVLVGWMGAEGAVRTNALVYLRISLFGVPPMLLELAGTGYLRGLQDTRTPLVIAAVTAAGNLVAEVVLIFGFGQGIGAAALTTVLAHVAGATVYVHRVARGARRHGASLAPDAASLVILARVGRDLMIRTAALRATLVIATAVAARLGTADVAAHQVAFEIWSFLALALDAVAIAGQALVGRFLGASEGEAARSAARRMVEWGVALGVVLGLVVAALHRVLPPLFTSDEEVIALTAFLLLWVASLQPVNAVAFVLDGVLIGAGDMRFLAWAMAGAAAVFVPAALAVVVLDLGIGWLWAALGLLMVTRAVTLGARLGSGRWVVLGAPAD